MRFVSKRCLILSAIFFVMPIFVYPVSGSIGHDITTYTYGFPFKWISIHFTAHGGRLFFTEALASEPQSFDFAIITAILNFIILYIVVRAVIVVFGQKREQYKKKKSGSKELPEEPDPSDKSEEQ